MTKAFGAKTFGSVLAENRGTGPGFDTVRAVLAVAVMAWHTTPVLTGQRSPWQETPVEVLQFSILPMFFALSGFLVAGSAERLPLRAFMLNRFARILPALGVEIALSALLLGPLLTTLPLADYVTAPAFRAYFANVAGWVHYTLPGVFTATPTGVVNASLWTIPLEISCYLLMTLYIGGRLVRRPGALLAAAAALVAAGWLLGAWAQAAAPGRAGGLATLVIDLFVHDLRGPPLPLCFTLGVAAHAARDRLPMHPALVVLALAAVLLPEALAGPGFWRDIRWFIVLGPALVYLVCYAGLSRLPGIPGFRGGDYSYGVYLYAYPIQQLLYEISPWLRTHAFAHFAASLAATLLFATLSWRWVEEPVLRWRRRCATRAA